MKKRISLTTAVLININIIVGSAFFIGAKEIALKSGAFAPMTWILFGLILIPLILVLSQLSKIYPQAGGLYLYSKENVSDFAGFLSGWGYYIGTIAGNAIIIHKFSERICSFLTISTNILLLDIIFIAIFTALNLLNIDFLEKMQIGFTTLKTIPILALLLSSIFLFSSKNVTTTQIDFSGFIDSIPLVLFAYLGFEACCAISHKIKNGEKNTGRAIIISFFLIMFLYAAMQLSILGIFGSKPMTPFLGILPLLTTNKFFIFFGNKIIDIAIISSFLGGFYSMFYANNWNMYAIANEKQILFSNHLTKLNRNEVPYISIILQGILTLFFLLITTNTKSLITMSDYGVVIAYLLSTISFLAIYKKNNVKKLILGLLSLTSCSYLIFICTKNLLIDGIWYLLPFLTFIGIGATLYKLRMLKNNRISSIFKNL